MEMNPVDSGSIGAERVDYRPLPQLPERPHELIELIAFIETDLHGLNNSINRRVSGIHDQIHALTIAAEQNQDRSNASIVSAPGVNFGFRAKGHYHDNCL